MRSVMLRPVVGLKAVLGGYILFCHTPDQVSQCAPFSSTFATKFTCAPVQCLHTCLGIHECRFSLATPWFGLRSLLPLVGSAHSLSLGLLTAVHPAPGPSAPCLGTVLVPWVCSFVSASECWCPHSLPVAHPHAYFWASGHSVHTAASWVFSDSIMTPLWGDTSFSISKGRSCFNLYAHFHFSFLASWVPNFVFSLLPDFFPL